MKIASRLKSKAKKHIMARLRVPQSAHGEPVLLAKHLERDKSIILVDVGAHDGEFTASIDRYCGVLTGILIEPLAHKAEALRNRFQLPQFWIFDCAVSAEAGPVEFEINDYEPTSSILHIKRGLPELAGVPLGDVSRLLMQAKTLDDIMAETGLDRVDLLKIDVQGAEHLVLRGAAETLTRVRMVWIEVSFKPLYELSCTFPEVHDLLTRFGFKLFEIEPGFRAPDGELLQADALFMR